MVFNAVVYQATHSWIPLVAGIACAVMAGLCQYTLICKKD